MEEEGVSVSPRPPLRFPLAKRLVLRCIPRMSSPLESLRLALQHSPDNTPLVLLCPAWKKWGDAKTVGRHTIILHSRADDVVPFADSEELVRNSGLSARALVEVGADHRLADPESLNRMLQACEQSWWDAHQ